MAKGKFNVDHLKKFNSPEITKGWKWPMQANKAHYFLNNDSLCGRWMIFFFSDLEDRNHKSSDNCARCKKIREDLEIATELFIENK